VKQMYGIDVVLGEAVKPWDVLVHDRSSVLAPVKPGGGLIKKPKHRTFAGNLRRRTVFVGGHEVVSVTEAETFEVRPGGHMTVYPVACVVRDNDAIVIREPFRYEGRAESRLTSVTVSVDVDGEVSL